MSRMVGSSIGSKSNSIGGSATILSVGERGESISLSDFPIEDNPKDNFDDFAFVEHPEGEDSERPPPPKTLDLAAIASLIKDNHGLIGVVKSDGRDAVFVIGTTGEPQPPWLPAGAAGL